MATTRTILKVVTAVFLTAGQVGSSLLVPFTQDLDKKYAYKPSTVILFSEIAKLVLSSIVLFFIISGRPKNEPSTATITGRSLFATFLLSALYFAANNAIYSIFQLVDATTYLISRSLSIITTAILSRLILSRVFSDVQWSAVLLVFFGAVMSQLKPVRNGEDGDSVFMYALRGYFLCILASFISSSAAIVYEKFTPKGNANTPTGTLSTLHKLFISNVQIYTWSVLLAIAYICVNYYQEHEKLLFWLPFQDIRDFLLDGYSTATYCLIMNYAIIGVVTSLLMTFADSMVKVFTSVVAMLLTAVLSPWVISLKAGAVVVNYWPSLQLLLGIGVVSVAIYLYFVPGVALQQAAHSQIQPKLSARTNNDKKKQ